MNNEQKVDVSNESLFGTLKAKCENQFTDLSNFIGIYNTSKNDIAEDFVKLFTVDSTLPFILNICSKFSDTNRRVYKCGFPEYDETYEFANIIREDYNLPISNVSSKRIFDYTDLCGRKNKNFSEFCTFDLSFDYPVSKLCIRNALPKAEIVESMPFKRFILSGCVPCREVDESVVDVADDATGNTRALLESIVTYFSLKYFCIVNFLTSLESVCHGDHNLADIRNMPCNLSKWYKTTGNVYFYGGLISTFLLDLGSIINSRLPDGIGVGIKLIGKPDGKAKIDYSKERVGLRISLLVEKELFDDNSASFVKMIDDYHARIKKPGDEKSRDKEAKKDEESESS